MRDQYDRSSKWLIEHRGNSILRLGGAGPIRSWRALQADIVQPRRLPDGLVEAQVLTGLRYNDVGLLAIIGGRRTMIESPVIQELVAEKMQDQILRVLTARFGSVPQEIVSALRRVPEESRLEELTDWAAVCPDLAAFRARLV